ncbi:hypothetical protein DVH24_003166 [Malus domestica]|uniref:Uncharacterized protein n=1 Tax=Malus domestica TaxID=3750 RepID=A0A498K6R6_MALDO|nr:hypothetical protein DVH24_003166 [Malus domestica]
MKIGESRKSMRQHYLISSEFFGIQYLLMLKQCNWVWQQAMGGRGVIGDRWSMRILWACAIGSAVSLYMVAVDRQLKNRERALAEELKAMEAESGSGERLFSAQESMFENDDVLSCVRRADPGMPAQNASTIKISPQLK